MTMLAHIAAAGGGALPQYIEDVFSTYLYTGNSTTRTITNGIDLAGKGGLVWFKARSGANGPALIDTARGGTQVLATNANNGQSNFSPQGISAFNADGFTFGTTTTNLNASGTTYVSWTFRKQPKFFDVQTFTSNAAYQGSFSHNLGSVPGCVIIKSLTNASDWIVYHRSIGTDNWIFLNTTAAQTSQTGWITVTSTQVTFNNGCLPFQNEPFVAYIFAHDAGGFGLTGTDNVVSCGGFTANGSGQATVNLGYEPQLVLYKLSSTTGPWLLMDSTRGMPDLSSNLTTSNTTLFPNTAAAESGYDRFWATSTGFYLANGTAGATYIYMAIRRGPMAVPTDGTKVYNAIARTGTGAAATVTGVGFTPDWLFTKSRSNVTGSMVADRLRGAPYLQTNANSAEVDNSAVIDATAFSTTMDGFHLSASSTLNNFSSYTYINYLFKRAPVFFDEACYTGTSVARTVPHNLAAVPEMMIVKITNDANEWLVYHSSLGATKFISLNRAFAEDTVATIWDNTAPTASVFTVGTSLSTAAATYVAYLFATCAGVSKVGGYTGTAATQVINCGFAAGARFVLIKRTDASGDWYYWDSARGIVAGDDPYLLMNTTAAEVTGTDYVDAAATGFELTSTAPAAINASGGSYIFLAVA